MSPIGRTSPGTALAAILLLATLGAALPAAGQIPVSGHVTIAGKPVTGAAVEILPVYTSYQRETSFFQKGEFFPEPIARSRSSATGYFTVEAPGPGMWTVVVRATGFVAMNHQLAPLLGATTLPPVELRRNMGTTVRVDTGDEETVATVWMATWPMNWQLWREGRTDNWLPRARLARFGKDGTLTTPRAEGEEVRLRLFAPGYLETVENGVTAKATVTLLPVTTPRRHLLVRDSKGRPEPGVMILAGGGAWTQGLTDERGRVSFLHPRSDPTGISLRSPSGFVQQLALPPAEATDPQKPFVVDLEPRSLSGLVLEDKSGKPIADAWVWNHGAKLDAVRTDANGEWQMVTAPGRPASIRAAAVGYLEGWGAQQSPSDNERQPPVSLRPAAAVGGWVVDRDARPVAGARITAGEQYLQGGFSTWTGEDGSFYLGQLPPARRTELVVRKDGLAEHTHELPALEPFKIHDHVRIVLGAGALAFGHVVDVDLQPIPGVQVTLRKPAEDASDRAIRWFEDGSPWDIGAGKLRSATTDDEGRFELPNAPDGLFDLTLEATGFAPRNFYELEIPGDVETTDLGRIVLEPAAVIAGVVVDERDRPLADARIFAFPDNQGTSFNLPFFIQDRAPDTTSDRAGRYAIDTLEPGVSIHLIADLDGYLLTGLPGIEAPTEGLRVVMKRGSTVSGRVLGPDGEPVTGTSVHLQIPDEAQLPGGTGLFPIPTERDGSFTFERIPPGSIRIAASAPDYPPAFLESLELQPGRDVEDLEIRLSAGAILSGRVIDAAGEPLVGARVSYMPAFLLEFHNSGSPKTATTDDRGAYRLTGLPISTERISAQHENHGRVSENLELVLGENHHDFVVGTGATVRGTVVGPADEPVAGASVWFEQLTGESRRFHSKRSTAAGEFTFQGVAPGEYRLRASYSGLASRELEDPIRVDPEGVSGLILRLGAGITLSGRVLGIEPPRRDRVIVQARREMLSGGQSAVDAEGAYRISNLGPGAWTLSASVGGAGRQIQRRITVNDGDGDVVFDLDFSAGIELSGTVVADGDPVTGITVILSGGDEHRAQQITDYRGQFRFQGLESGTYEVTVGHNWQRPTHHRTVDLNDDQEMVIDLADESLR